MKQQLDSARRRSVQYLETIQNRKVCTPEAVAALEKFDEPFPEQSSRAEEVFHVDNAFGLWAAAAPTRAQLVKGMDAADSWATDAHKWLDVPYDCGIAFSRDADALRTAMAVSAAYLPTVTQHRNPSLSRR